MSQLCKAMYALLQFKHYYPKMYVSLLFLMGVQEDPFEDGIRVRTFKKRLKELSNAVQEYDKCEVSIWGLVKGKRWIRVVESDKLTDDSSHLPSRVSKN